MSEPGGKYQVYLLQLWSKGSLTSPFASLTCWLCSTATWCKLSLTQELKHLFLRAQSVPSHPVRFCLGSTAPLPLLWVGSDKSLLLVQVKSCFGVLTPAGEFSEVTQLPELPRWCRGGEFFQKSSGKENGSHERLVPFGCNTALGWSGWNTLLPLRMGETLQGNWKIRIKNLTRALQCFIWLGLVSNQDI